MFQDENGPLIAKILTQGSQLRKRCRFFFFSLMAGAERRNVAGCIAISKEHITVLRHLERGFALKLIKMFIELKEIVP